MPDAWPTDRLLASIVESSEDAIVSKDLNGTITSWNMGAQNLFGFTAAEAVGNSITIIFPSDRLTEEPAILERIRHGERIAHFETVRCHKDHHSIDISLSISPIRSTAGNIIGVSKIARDISMRKRIEEQRLLLLSEMGHRIKNVLAVVSGLAALSARSAETPQQMAKILCERIDAYVRAHELTRPGLISEVGQQDIATDLRTLIATVTAPYTGSDGQGDGASIQYVGKKIPITGEAVTSLALVLHEFTTNSAKYGALSQNGGRVLIQCRIEGDKCVLIWRESGGPLLSMPPTRSGFGTLLARRTIEGHFHGVLHHEWHSSGVEITLRIPTANLYLT